MLRMVRMRWTLTSAGALAGLSLYLLGEIMAQGLLTPRLALALFAFGAVFFGGLLAMTGPLGLGRAASGALAVALVVAALLSWAGLRHPAVEGLFETPYPLLAAAVLGFLPLPFWMSAAGRGGWFDYQTLFTQSWTIVVRYAAAWVFVGLAWAVLLLSGALLSLVGIELIDALMDVPPVPYLVTGAALGLALAVVTELADLVSPYLLLRLMRLLLPVVLVVVAVFLVALPLQGFARLLGGLSVAATLLAIAALAITLVSTAVDARDDEAVAAPFLRACTQGLAALVLPVALLAAWAVWQRVGAEGWTPARVAAAAVTGIALGYGLAYLRALLSGRRWMARVRSGNLGMALVVLALAALSLTPVLNAEAISARSQMARFAAGEVTVAALDLAALSRWGHAGGAALAALEEQAALPGQEVLAAMLAQNKASRLLPQQAEPEALRVQLANIIPLRPATATAERDAILSQMDHWELQGWMDGCARILPDATPGCVLVVADFLPRVAGQEAMFLALTPDGLLRQEALLPSAGGAYLRANVENAAPPASARPGAAEILMALQAADPVLEPEPRFQLQTPAGALAIAP
jgi:hypothetical protein